MGGVEGEWGGRVGQIKCEGLKTIYSHQSSPYQSWSNHGPIMVQYERNWRIQVKSEGLKTIDSHRHRPS